MDLICCRNRHLSEPVLQSKVISLFHYALRGHGFLVLGASEGIGSAGNLFAIEDRGLKIFSKRPAAAPVGYLSLGRVPDRGEAFTPGSRPSPSTAAPTRSKRSANSTAAC